MYATPTVLCLYRCLGHALKKMCILIGYIPQIIFFHKIKKLGILCMQHLLQFNGDSYETLHPCLGHGLKTCILSLFQKKNELSHYSCQSK